MAAGLALAIQPAPPPLTPPRKGEGNEAAPADSNDSAG
jgi:hypothetical protein